MCDRLHRVHQHKIYPIYCLRRNNFKEDVYLCVYIVCNIGVDDTQHTCTVIAANPWPAITGLYHYLW